SRIPNLTVLESERLPAVVYGELGCVKVRCAVSIGPPQPWVGESQLGELLWSKDDLGRADRECHVFAHIDIANMGFDRGAGWLCAPVFQRDTDSQLGGVGPRRRQS